MSVLEEGMVEVGALARVPGECPAELLLPGVELGKRRARDDDHGSVLGADVAKVGDVLAWMGGGGWLAFAWLLLDKSKVQ